MVRVERRRLTERLKRAISLPITVVEGAAGCGKSVALFDALSAGERPFALFDVGPEHGRLPAFVQGLADALAPYAPGARVAFGSAYSRAIVSPQPTHSLAVWLQEHLKDLDLTIAFDNLHNADGDPLTHAFVGHLLERTLTNVRWVLCARATHYLPIASWLAFGRMELPVGEADLAFTDDEIEALARGRRISLASGAAHAIEERTGGWATGVAFLLEPGADGGDGSPVRALEPLIERVLGAYDADALRSLLATYYLPELSVELLLAIGGHALARQVDELRVRSPFLFTGGRVPRYHDRFREALRARLSSVDPAQKQAALDSAAYVLTHYKRFVECLSLRLETGQADACIDILEKQGIELIEQGHAHLVEAVVASLQYMDAELPASVIALRAMIDSRLGRFDTAEAWFAQAIARAASGDARMIEIKYLYARDLLRRDRLDCLPMLREHVDDESLPVSLRASIAAALAEGLQLSNEPDAARIEIEKAVALEREAGEDVLHARISAGAAYVYLYQGDYGRARELALEAARVATIASQFTIATTAYSILYVIAFDTEDVRAALDYLDLLLESCLKSGHLQFQFYCLACSFEIEMERNNVEAIERIDATLRSFDVYYDISVSDEAFLPGDAMRSAMQGDFARAYRVLHPTARNQAGSERVALRWAEVALYAAGALQMRDAGDAVAHALSALEEVETTSNRALRARLLLALALVLLGRSDDAKPLLAQVATETRAPDRIRAIETAIVALCAYVSGASNHDAVADALLDMRRRECGGIARVFEALPSRERYPNEVTA